MLQSLQAGVRNSGNLGGPGAGGGGGGGKALTGPSERCASREVQTQAEPEVPSLAFAIRLDLSA